MSQITQPLDELPPAQEPAPVDALFEDDPEQDEWIRDALTSPDAMGYYLSTGLHLLAFLLAAFIFTVVTDVFDDPPPLQASLGEEEVIDGKARFEAVIEVNKGEVQGDSAMDRLANLVRPNNDGELQTLPEQAVPSLMRSSAETGDESENEFLLRVPEGGLAVTKGSFTAWTIPARPRPGENYQIIIEVKLKEGTPRYRLSDLIGTVKGTDGFSQKLPYDKSARRPSMFMNQNNVLQAIQEKTVAPVRNNKVQLIVEIPGAGADIQDTINIRSRRLRESQTLMIVFKDRR